jgi:hypothetical protein
MNKRFTIIIFRFNNKMPGAASDFTRFRRITSSTVVGKSTPSNQAVPLPTPAVRTTATISSAVAASASPKNTLIASATPRMKKTGK